MVYRLVLYLNCKIAFLALSVVIFCWCCQLPWSRVGCSQCLFEELLKPHRLWPASTSPIFITAGWAKLMTCDSVVAISNSIINTQQSSHYFYHSRFQEGQWVFANVGREKKTKKTEKVQLPQTKIQLICSSLDGWMDGWSVSLLLHKYNKNISSKGLNFSYHESRKQKTLCE